MIGWRISVYRQTNGGNSPAEFSYANVGPLVAVWSSASDGLGWFEDLAEQGKAIALGGDGYPFEFTAKTIDLETEFIEGSAGVNQISILDPKEPVPSLWDGWMCVYREELKACHPDEWLLIKVFDQS